VEAQGEIVLLGRGKQAVISPVAIRSVGADRQQDLDEAGLVAASSGSTVDTTMLARKRLSRARNSSLIQSFSALARAA
jgi:hypothetical protein